MQNPSPSPQNQVNTHVFISGKVQGVGYRHFTMKQASHLNINGWVRNLPDGRVEAVFEGDREIVEKMIHWCYEGSPSAVVRDVTVKYSETEGLEDFEIRR